MKVIPNFMNYCTHSQDVKPRLGKIGKQKIKIETKLKSRP